MKSIYQVVETHFSMDTNLRGKMIKELEAREKKMFAGIYCFSRKRCD